MKPRTPSPLRLEVIRLAARPEGLSTSEVPGHEVRQVGRVVEHLLDARRVHRGRAGSKVRFFGHKDDAEAFIDAWRLSQPVRVPRDDGARAPWPADAPINETANTIYTQCPPSMLGIHRTNTHHDEH